MLFSLHISNLVFSPFFFALFITLIKEAYGSPVPTPSLNPAKLRLNSFANDTIVALLSLPEHHLKEGLEKRVESRLGLLLEKVACLSSDQLQVQTLDHFPPSVSLTIKSRGRKPNAHVLYDRIHRFVQANSTLFSFVSQLESEPSNNEWLTSIPSLCNNGILQGYNDNASINDTKLRFLKNETSSISFELGRNTTNSLSQGPSQLDKNNTQPSAAWGDAVLVYPEKSSNELNKSLVSEDFLYSKADSLGAGKNLSAKFLNRTLANLSRQRIEKEPLSHIDINVANATGVQQEDIFVSAMGSSTYQSTQRNVMANSDFLNGKTPKVFISKPITRELVTVSLPQELTNSSSLFPEPLNVYGNNSSKRIEKESDKKSFLVEIHTDENAGEYISLKPNSTSPFDHSQGSVRPDGWEPSVVDILSSRVNNVTEQSISYSPTFNAFVSITETGESLSTPTNRDHILKQEEHETRNEYELFSRNNKTTKDVLYEELSVKNTMPDRADTSQKTFFNNISNFNKDFGLTNSTKGTSNTFKWRGMANGNDSKLYLASSPFERNDVLDNDTVLWYALYTTNTDGEADDIKPSYGSEKELMSNLIKKSAEQASSRPASSFSNRLSNFARWYDAFGVPTNPQSSNVPISPAVEPGNADNEKKYNTDAPSITTTFNLANNPKPLDLEGDAVTTTSNNTQATTTTTAAPGSFESIEGATEEPAVSSPETSGIESARKGQNSFMNTSNESREHSSNENPLRHSSNESSSQSTNVFGDESANESGNNFTKALSDNSSSTPYGDTSQMSNNNSTDTSDNDSANSAFIDVLHAFGKFFPSLGTSLAELPLNFLSFFVTPFQQLVSNTDVNSLTNFTHSDVAGDLLNGLNHTIASLMSLTNETFSSSFTEVPSESLLIFSSMPMEKSSFLKFLNPLKYFEENFEGFSLSDILPSFQGASEYLGRRLSYNDSSLRGAQRHSGVI